MNSNKLVKQEKDSFLVYCDFSHVLAAEETITAYECSVEDSAGVDATVEILEPGSEIIGSGDDKAFLYVRVRNGKARFSPYTVTMQAQTSLGHRHKVAGKLVVKGDE